MPPPALFPVGIPLTKTRRFVEAQGPDAGKVLTSMWFEKSMSMEGNHLAFTVGYEGKMISGFLQELCAARIQTVIDVRERAQSRKRGFSKVGLGAALAEKGIEYVHLPQLGSPSKIRQEYRRTGDLRRFRVRYSKYASTQGTALTAVAGLLRTRRAALLCFERDWDSCHRQILCSRLQRRGFSFSHL